MVVECTVAEAVHADTSLACNKYLNRKDNYMVEYVLAEDTNVDNTLR